jgi:hypothetical protein
LDAVVPDDAAPVAEVARCRLVRCRVNKGDLRAARRKVELDARASAVKAAHKQAAKRATAKGEVYAKPSQAKKAKKKAAKNADGSQLEELEEDFSFQYFIRVCVFSSVDPIGGSEAAYEEGMKAEAQTWQGELSGPHVPKAAPGSGGKPSLPGTSGAPVARSRLSVAEMSAGGSAAAAERAAKALQEAAAAAAEADDAEDASPEAFETPRDEDEEEVRPSARSLPWPGRLSLKVDLCGFFAGRRASVV